MTRLELAWTIGGALLGRHGTTSGIESLLVGDCAIKADHRRLLVATDGELGRLETPLHYRIRPRALRVIVPAATNAGA
jgi:diacylglycerol kinase family enzyme